MTMTRISGDKAGDGYAYDYITRREDGTLRLYSQVCHVDEDGYIVADHDPTDATDTIDADGLRGWADTWTLDTEHGDPADCIVGLGEKLIAHKLTRNEELDRVVGTGHRDDEPAEYSIAYMIEATGEFDVVETFTAADDAAANAYAEANHDGEWYVLNAAGRNINAGIDR
jgi:hypothetical protein